MNGYKSLGEDSKNNAAPAASFTRLTSEELSDDSNFSAESMPGLRTALGAILGTPRIKIEDLRQYPLLYLATPYRLYPQGPVGAHMAAARLTAHLIQDGLRVFSPIAHSHPVAWYGDISKDYNWLRYDEAFMAKCDGLIVAMMPTWEKSKGIQYETHYFMDHNKPIFYLDTETNQLV